MSNDTQNDDDGYDYLVEAAYEALEESGFRDIRVSGYEDMPEPDAINGHVPDLQATNSKGIVYLFEICPREAFAIAELVDRMQAFTAHAAATKAQVILLVPEGDEDIAGAFLEEHDISEDNLTIWEA